MKDTGSELAQLKAVRAPAVVVELEPAKVPAATLGQRAQAVVVVSLETLATAGRDLGPVVAPPPVVLATCALFVLR